MVELRAELGRLENAHPLLSRSMYILPAVPIAGAFFKALREQCIVETILHGIADRTQLRPLYKV